MSYSVNYLTVFGIVVPCNIQAIKKFFNSNLHKNMKIADWINR
jgi:hypothetical protein